ncbi:MAG: hypothetical protein V4471_05325 [Pseudomonadota bacterium]
MIDLDEIQLMLKNIENRIIKIESSIFDDKKLVAPNMNTEPNINEKIDKIDERFNNLNKQLKCRFDDLSLFINAFSQDEGGKINVENVLNS